ncbi:DUF262 domain-containing protein [Ralstonia pseudosolanacearum]|uniref:DUF262 domain-containing protein n=1 Tax=Ralstonia pseudosolanacearum TaxID=1310165 RepID=UPI001FF93321
MSNKEELIQEAKTFEEGDSEQPIPPPDIVAYNELRSCADLVRMHASGKLELQPDFQRDIVWKQDDQSRFIDSLGMVFRTHSVELSHRSGADA